MKEEIRFTESSGKISKKTYQKPTLSRVKLVAEEAVLAFCKNGGFSVCDPLFIDCISIPSS